MLAREAAGWGRVDMNTPTAELPEAAKGWCEHGSCDAAFWKSNVT